MSFWVSGAWLCWYVCLTYLPWHCRRPHNPDLPSKSVPTAGKWENSNHFTNVSNQSVSLYHLSQIPCASWRFRFAHHIDYHMLILSSSSTHSAYPLDLPLLFILLLKRFVNFSNGLVIPSRPFCPPLCLPLCLFVLPIKNPPHNHKFMIHTQNSHNRNRNWVLALLYQWLSRQVSDVCLQFTDTATTPTRLLFVLTLPRYTLNQVFKLMLLLHLVY